MNKFHFGTMAEVQKNFKCCDDPCFEEGDRSYPPDDDFIIEYNCTNCGKRTLDHYKLVCMEEVVEDVTVCSDTAPCEYQESVDYQHSLKESV